MKNTLGPISLIASINKEIDFLFEKLLKDLEITKMESFYLKLIFDNPGITQYDIAKETNFEKSLVTKYITNLECKGLIEKRMLDKRKKGLYLIKDGEKAIDYIKSFIPELQNKFDKLFTKEEIELFITLLIRFKNSLEKVNERDFKF